MKEPKKDISRRRFLGLAGATAAIASTGFSSQFKKNKPKLNLNQITQDSIETDVLVIGSGIAGLFAAVKAHDANTRVLMVSKGRLGASGQTPFARGIFSFDQNKEKLSLDEFVDQVSKSALGTNNPVYTRQMAEHSKDRVDELTEWGFFNSPLYNKSFSKPIKERNIPVDERIVITHLIKENGKIAGASGFSLDDNKLKFYRAKSVILCTGAGGFKPNGFPICDLTHDGTAMAYQIGAKVTGKEWNDGHPAQAENSAACFDNWHGMFEDKPKTTSIEIRHDLGVDLNYKTYKSGNSLKMGLPHQHNNSANISGGPFVPQEFQRGGRPEKGDKGHRPPHRDGAKGPRKAPPGMGGSPVGGSSAGMAIHKAEGLVPVNEKCESNIPGLYAAGDALGSYMAGAIYTQIGSSMAGSAVQGGVAGEAAAEYAKKKPQQNISEAKIKELKNEILAPLKRESGYSPAWVTQTLQGIMIPNFVLYIKKESMLRAALAYVEELRDHHVPMLCAEDIHELRLAHETINMILNAEMKLKASLMRKESRCSHYRLDYPDHDDENWQAWINIYKDRNGEMELEKQNFKDWPASS